MTASQNEDLSPSTPPIEQAKSADGEQTELATGTAVIFQHRGSAEAGVKTRVTGKVTQPDGMLLYRLEQRAEGKPFIKCQLHGGSSQLLVKPEKR